MQIQEKEKMYTEMKSVLERQPGPEVVEQLSIYEHTLKDKSRQLKAMASELSISFLFFFLFSLFSFFFLPSNLSFCFGDIDKYKICIRHKQMSSSYKRNH